MVVIKYLTGIFFCAWLTLGVAMAGEPVELAALPKPVIESIERALPGAKLLRAEKDTEDGKPVYEVRVTHRGKTKEVELAPDGEILEIDTKS